MLEILILWFGSNKIAEMAENKGQSGLLWRLLFIASWFLGAIFSACLGVALVSAGGRGPSNLAVYGYAIVGAFLGIGAVTLVIAVWPEPRRGRGYMDDYEEYQRTGRVHRYGDREDSRRQPRRRPRDDEYEDRPRRRYEDDRPRRDDRYREDDRPRRQSRDDEDRPRRPRDDDYDDRPRRPRSRDEDY
jgi:hypothetical protein